MNSLGAHLAQARGEAAARLLPPGLRLPGRKGEDGRRGRRSQLCAPIARPDDQLAAHAAGDPPPPSPSTSSHPWEGGRSTGATSPPSPLPLPQPPFRSARRRRGSLPAPYTTQTRRTSPASARSSCRRCCTDASGLRSRGAPTCRTRRAPRSSRRRTADSRECTRRGPARRGRGVRRCAGRVRRSDGVERHSVYEGELPEPLPRERNRVPSSRVRVWVARGHTVRHL